MVRNFEYLYLESGIHRFKWHSVSQDAALEYFTRISQIYENSLPDTSIIRILHDYQPLPFISFTYVIPKMKALQQCYPDLNRKIAYLSDIAVTDTLVQSVTRIVKRSGERRVFKLNEEEHAITWLLAEE